MSEEPVLADLVPADLDRIAALERAAHGHPWSPELLGREFDHAWSTVLGARVGGALVGFAIFWIVYDEIHLLDVAVEPALRRRGIGRALLAEMERRGRARGTRLMTLEVRRSNEAARGLYRALGWDEVGERRAYYVDNDEDAIVMTRTLGVRTA